MAGLDHAADDFRQRRIRRQAYHLSAWQHDVGDGEVRYFDRALDHRQRVVGEQPLGLRAAQLFEQFVDVAGFAGNQLPDAFEPGAGGGGTRVVLVHCVGA